MSWTTRSLFATASLAALLASGASHAASTQINGGGSTLAYPTYLAQFTDLYKVSTAYIFGNTNASPKVSYYGGVGSGKGTNAFLTNDATLLNGGSAVLGTPAPTFTAGTPVHYGASDAVLTSAQVSAYDTGTGLGVTNGPLIQLPAFGTPVTVAFNDGTITAVTLNDNDLCGIFSGKITNWNQTSVSASVPANPITVVFRGDGSGTSFLFNNHLVSVCTTGASGNSNVTFTAQNYFAAPFTTLPANFLPATGSGGVQADFLNVLTATAGAPVTISGSYVTSSTSSSTTVTRTISNSSEVAYLGPDYTSIAPKAGNYNASVKVASLRNARNGTAYLPTTSNTTAALATSAAPPSTAADAADPTKWVPLTPNPSSGYPIVGFTNLILSQCYKVANVTSGIKAFLQDEYNNNTSFANEIANNGFVKVPNLLSATYVTAINNTFLTNSSGYKLDIGDTTKCKNGGTSGTYAGR